ncbi:PHP domain-containing protein, partial [bacterium]|nr:PHP domain-containing protein [bacterium]
MSSLDYTELTCFTHDSFLRGASSPEEMVYRAAELGLSGLAITDWNGVYGIPRAFQAWKEVVKKKPHFKLITGAKLFLELEDESNSVTALSFIALNRAGYGLLCRIITAAHSGREKGKAALRASELEF